MNPPSLPLRILIVDDQREVRRMIKAALEAQFPQASLVDVPSAEEAMVLLAQGPFNLLVVDIRLAGMSGLEMVEKARRRQPNLNIIVVTGLNDPAVDQQLEQAPIQGWFRKPLPMEDFLACAANLLKSETAQSPAIQSTPALSTEETAQPKANPWDALCERLGLQALWISDREANLVAQSTLATTLPQLDRMVEYFSQVESAIMDLQTRYRAEEFLPLAVYLTQEWVTSAFRLENTRVYFCLKRAQLPGQPLALQMALLQKAGELLDALREAPVYFGDELSPEHPKEDAGVKAEEIAEPNLTLDAELEALLQNPAAHLSQAEQADQFWEQGLSAEEWTDSMGQSQTLPFHQARQLGLLPSEENETSFRD